MIEQLDQQTKERVNKAIANIRLIASRSKRAQVLDAVQRAETVVNLLNDFRHYINMNQERDGAAFLFGTFKHDTTTLERITQATFQADNIYNALARANKKRYQEEYQQVWLVLENIHAYLTRIIEGKASYA